MPESMDAPAFVDAPALIAAILRVSAALLAQQDYLLALDQAVGDGDLGITLGKIAAEMQAYVVSAPTDDLGKFLASAGMAANRVGSSSMGTLLATALMRAGKEGRGLAALAPPALAAMLTAADLGVQERGKAQMGDKTIVDVLHPAAEAFAAAVAAGEPLAEAGQKLLQAAEAGRDRVTPLQCKVGRASWAGERSIGQVDPGCAALVIIFKAIVS
jgi:phosphoenolpyruvate---glycerone phosphotransferase subunit DhaL